MSQPIVTHLSQIRNELHVTETVTATATSFHYIATHSQLVSIYHLQNLFNLNNDVFLNILGKLVYI